MLLFERYSVCFIELALLFAVISFLGPQKGTEAFSIQRLAIPSSRSRRSTVLMGSKPVTYTSVTVPWNPDSQLLVKDSEHECLQQVKLFAEHGGPEDQRLVGDWVAKGLAFWLNDDGMTKLHASERRRMDIEPQRINEWTGSGQYINFGTDLDPVYMEKTLYDRMVLSGVLRKGEQDPAFVRRLVEDGQAFDDLEHLFETEGQARRSLDTVERIREHHNHTSPEYRAWVNASAEANTTSLQQVIGTYMADYSLADTGGENYVPLRGYVGTLAPGETFEDQLPTSKLPRKVMHPWPAVQEIDVVNNRNPPIHPYIANPVVLLAQNDLLLLGEWDRMALLLRDEWIEETGKVPHITLDDRYMTAVDAHLLAKEGTMGRCYLPEEQIPHGGMVFDYGQDLPFYNPDHGPTAPEAEVEHDLEPELKKLLTRWPDPDEAYAQNFERPGDVPVAADEGADQQREEAARRARVEQLLRGVDLNPDTVDGAPSPEPGMPLWLTNEAAAEEEVERRLRIHVEHIYAQQAELEIKLGHARASQEAKKEEFDWQPDDVQVDDLTELIDFEALRHKYRHEINTARHAALNRPGHSGTDERTMIKYTIQAAPVWAMRVQEGMQAARIEALLKTTRRAAGRKKGEDSSGVGGSSSGAATVSSSNILESALTL